MEDKLHLLDKEQHLYLQIMEDLNKPFGDGTKVGLKGRLHPDQIEQLKPLYDDSNEINSMFISCGRKWGKDLGLYEPVLTPSGWVPIKDIKEGDLVISGKGIPTKVNIISPIYTDHKCYKVRFQDGTEIIAGEDHKWEVGNKHGSWKVLQTKELTPNWFRTKLPIIQGEKKELLLDPYLLGLWLGDGSSHDSKITTVDDEILNAFSSKFEIGCKDRITYYVKGMKPILRELNLLKNKHIPEDYMQASVEQRLELLKGLMDTDGYTDSRGVCEFVQKNERLFNQVVDLMRSLGLRVSLVKDKNIEGNLYKRLHTSANKQIFKLPRKAEKLEPFIDSIRRQYKNIISVEPTNTIETKCIGVECDSHTFITRNYTITHNTELVGYVLWRHALLNPGSACYYVGPEATHARKILWDTQRIQKFMGKDTSKYLLKTQDQPMKIILKNGSFIQLVGSDNYAVANGLTPHVAVYDEFKAFNHRWHTEFAPNRAAKAAPLVIIGTKPRPGNKNMDQYNEILEYANMNPKEWYVAERTTFDNPINHLPAQKQIIDQEIKQLLARGEEDVVQLEYYSKVLPGGKKSIFPMFDRNQHIKPHDKLINEISKDIKRMEWYLIADPGTVTCFGALLACINPYSKQVYILDEIYEKNQRETSTRRIYPRMEGKALDLYPGSSVDDDWMKVADEAAAWYMNEVMDQFHIYFSPTNKNHNKKEEGLSLIKDQMIHKLVNISDRCVHLANEVEKYSLDDKGNIPKINDHLIDCWRYLNGAAHYNMHEILEAVRYRSDQETIRKGRYRNLKHSSEKRSKDDDWMRGVFDLEFE